MLERGRGQLSPHIGYWIPTDTEGKASAIALLQSPSAQDIHLPVVAVFNLLSSLVDCYENGLSKTSIVKLRKMIDLIIIHFPLVGCVE